MAKKKNKINYYYHLIIFPAVFLVANILLTYLVDKTLLSSGAIIRSIIVGFFVGLFFVAYYYFKNTK